MRVDEFETAVLEIEEILIRIRAPKNTEVKDYDFERQASAETTLTKWLYNRVNPRLNGHEVSVIDGNYQEPYGQTKLRTLRDSYER